MSLILLCCIFFFGACVGSFSAVLIESASLTRSFWTGRSQCASCKKILAWYELIPLVSYVIQGGKCRACGARIPRWIWLVEWYMGFLWMVTAMLLSLGGFGIFSLVLHIVLLTWLSILVIDDMRSQTISDTQSIPLIGATIVIYIVLHFFPHTTLLPSWSVAVLGAFFGMLFYMLQMIIPALYETIRRRRLGDIFAILVSPFIFPLWLLVKGSVGEKKADRLFPTLNVFDDLPTWVGGGDIRLGIIIGALAGLTNFLPVVMYGYVLGTVYFALKLVITGKKLKTLPVAPLLFFGLCVVWILHIFS